MSVNFESSSPLLSIALLAGGKNSRMGKNKALLTLNEKTFIERLIEEFSVFDQILLSVKDDSVWWNEGKGKLSKLPPEIEIVKDENQEYGPLEGLRRVLSEARNDYVFVCACDMPFATKKIPEYLQEFFSSDYQIYVPTIGGKPEPLCAVYKKSILPAIENQLRNSDFKLSHLFESIHTKFIPVEKSALNKKEFININTPEDYKRAISPIVFCVSGIKNSGKTRMIISLISEFKKRNFSVGVIKHDGHDCFTDAPNTDTAYFKEMGAVTTAIFSDSRFAFHASDSLGAENLIEKMKSLQNPPDIIIIEGMKDSSYPKIEVMRKNVSEKSLCKKETLICTASDFEFKLDGVPNFDFEDVASIATCIESYGDFVK